jgi:hypothetical protein
MEVAQPRHHLDVRVAYLDDVAQIQNPISKNFSSTSRNSAIDHNIRSFESSEGMLCMQMIASQVCLSPSRWGLLMVSAGGDHFFVDSRCPCLFPTVVCRRFRHDRCKTNLT